MLSGQFRYWNRQGKSPLPEQPPTASTEPTPITCQTRIWEAVAVEHYLNHGCCLAFTGSEAQPYAKYGF
ncbi:hypothetical protein EC96154_A0173 [Escherichia coli 96.154]|nr:hypothetical protein EC96154_A0173 [Escherichia coli 96.154]